MAQTRTVTEVARHFAEYINRVSYRGESFVLVRGNKPRGGTPPATGGEETLRTSLVTGVASPSLPH